MSSLGPAISRLEHIAGNLASVLPRMHIAERMKAVQHAHRSGSSSSGGGHAESGPLRSIAVELAKAVAAVAGHVSRLRDSKDNTPSLFISRAQKQAADEAKRTKDTDRKFEIYKRAGLMPDESDVSKRYRVAKPSKGQMVEAAESGLHGAVVRNAGGGMLGGTAKLAGAIAGLVTTAIAATLALKKLGSAAIEGQRELRRFDPRIAGTFAKLDRQQLILAGRTARATGGGAQTLGNQLLKLNDETQWLREMSQDIKNITGIALVGVARTLNAILYPIQKVYQVAKAFYEKWIGKLDDDKRGPPQQAHIDFLNQLRAGGHVKHFNPPPGRGQQAGPFGGRQNVGVLPTGRP
ncbi:MAG TPA: hypothetical protein VG713_05455 [Pirellulales bacterium]|nr:hypothetical protein [Pirellulales bacterium]